jgi:putative ABC transport system substrate-binding protein
VPVALPELVRRRLLAAGGAIAAALMLPRVRAQSGARAVGLLWPHKTDLFKVRPNPYVTPFLKKLNELGWIEGETLRFEHAIAENKLDRIPDLAKMLVDKKVDVIWAGGALAAVAAARATKTIPIVFWFTPWVLELGLVESFARPGGNVTGTAWTAGESGELALKQIQLLLEVAPGTKRLALISVPEIWHTVSGERLSVGGKSWNLEAGLRLLRVEAYRSFEIRTDGDVETAFDAIKNWRADCLFVPGTELTFRNSQRIVELARSNRLPAVYSQPAIVTRGGGLLSYSFDPIPPLVRTAEYIDRILRGAKPADLPVELPSRYLLQINLRAAKEIGLQVPQSILMRADEVIE